MTREEAIEVIRNLQINIGRRNGKHLIQVAMNMAIEALEKYEEAYEHGWTEAECKYREILERKRGEWIQIEDVDANGNALYECPFCRKSDCHAVSQTVSYCPNCGADMRGEDV